MEDQAKALALKALAISTLSLEIERDCWMVVHEYCHGFMPTEYDIRDINEELYLRVLEIAKSKHSAGLN